MVGRGRRVEKDMMQELEAESQYERGSQSYANVHIMPFIMHLALPAPHRCGALGQWSGYR